MTGITFPVKKTEIGHYHGGWQWLWSRVDIENIKNNICSQ